MARARDPNRDLAKQMYLDSNGKMLLKDIAAAVGKSDTQIRKWKNQDKWDDELKGNVTNGVKSNVTIAKGTKSTQKSAATTSTLSDDETVDLQMDEPTGTIEQIKDDGRFTDKQRLFISYYVKYWNATKAYQKAYGSAYSTARTEGARLLANPNIREEIIKVRDALTEDAMLNKRTLLQKWIDIAFADITDFVEFGSEQEVVRNWETGEVELDANGNPKMRTFSYVHLKDDVEVDGTILTSVTLGKDGVGVKLADKMKALEYLSKHIYLLSDMEKTKFESEQRKTTALIDKTKAEAQLKQKELLAYDEANKDKEITINFVRKGDA